MKKILALSLIVTFLSTPIQTAAESMQIPANTQVLIKLLEEVSSATHKKGDKIKCETAADVVIQGKKVIAAGTPVDAQVENASKRFIAGIGGQLDITVEKTTSVNGAPVPLQFKKGEHKGSSALPVVMSFVCCICALFFPGKDVSIEKDSIFTATTVGPTDLKP